MTRLRAKSDLAAIRFGETGASVRDRVQRSASALARSIFSRKVVAGDGPVDAIYSDAERDADLAGARAAFARLAALEAAYDPDLIHMYADDGVIVERTLENGAEKRVREIPARKYKAMLGRALKVSQKAQEVSRHDDIALSRIAPGWVIVTSRRTYTHSRAPAPHEVTLRRDEGGWRVVKETATLAR